VFHLGASPDVDDLPRQFSAQEQIQHEQGVQGDANVAAGKIPRYALLVLVHSRRQGLKE
jgi:hypothetical protein